MTGKMCIIAPSNRNRGGRPPGSKEVIVNTLGMHVILEMHNCTPKLLDNPEKCRRILYTIARRSGMTPLKDVFHTFSPHGLSGALLLAESHVSIHTWPEFGYAAVDFFTCNMETDTQLVEDLFVSMFRPSDYDFKILPRGEEVLKPHRIQKKV